MSLHHDTDLYIQLVVLSQGLAVAVDRGKKGKGETTVLLLFLPAFIGNIFSERFERLKTLTNVDFCYFCLMHCTVAAKFYLL